MRTRSIAVGFVPSAVLLVVACSGGSSTRAVHADAGADGAAGNESGSGGIGGKGGGGGGGAPGGGAGGASGGSGGADAGAGGGAGGSLPEAGLSGGVFFSVKKGAVGLPGSGVQTHPNPESAIFATNGSGPSHVAGTNIEGVSALLLGLLPTDELRDVAVLKPVPVHPLYHFSVADGASLGFSHTDVFRSSTEAGVPGDVFVSDGIGEHFDGESGRRPGANALTIDEARIGLSSTPTAGSDASPGSVDDVDGLELGVTGVPTKVYFTVAKSAAGAAGSAVAATAAAERGCTVFVSSLDGKNEKAFSCASIGLAPGDEIDALEVNGSRQPAQVLFSVTAGSVGATASAVEAEAASTEAMGDVFRSTGAGTNERVVDEVGLGLNPGDELDALSVTDEELVPDYKYADGSCSSLTPNPESDGVNPYVYTAYGKSWIGSGVIGITRQRSSVSGAPFELLAYDTATCAQIGSALPLDVAGDAGQLVYPRNALAIVPLAGWSKAAPLSNVEIWTSDQSGTNRLLRYAPGGGLPAQVVTLDAGVGPGEILRLVYRPKTDDFGLLFQGAAGKEMVFVTHPASNATTAPASPHLPVPYPCEEYEGFIGVDPAASGVELAAGYTLGTRVKVCSLDDELHFRKPPRGWIGATPPDSGASAITDSLYEGLIVPGTAIYGIDRSGGGYALVTLTKNP